MRELNPMEDVAMAGGTEASDDQIMGILVAHSVIQEYDQQLREMNETIPFLHSLAEYADYYAHTLKPSGSPFPSTRYPTDDIRSLFREGVTIEARARMVDHYYRAHAMSFAGLLSEPPTEGNLLVVPLEWIATLTDKLSDSWGVPFSNYVHAYRSEAQGFDCHTKITEDYAFYPENYYFDFRRLDGASVDRLSKELQTVSRWLEKDVSTLVYYPSNWPHDRCLLCDTWRQLTNLVNIFREAEPPAYLSPIQYSGAPRHGCISEGSLARLVADDLNDHLSDLIDMYENAAEPDQGPLRQKFSTIISDLRRLEPGKIRVTFRKNTRDVSFADVDPIGKPQIRQAFLAIAIHYLRDVQSRMTDYAEASGQKPPQPTYSIHISGGTINGQVALQISNIDSSISTVVSQGNEQLAEALEAVKRAVLEDPSIPDSDRQDLIDNVEYLAEAAQATPAERNRGILRSILSTLNNAATAAPQLSQALETWGTLLGNLA
ncbi:hypothetical protein ACFVH4_13085 [Nocardia ignorata]|uniref:hypothetical protein n=1 Tax=Nocardia ignorata TaxID=145285 RepID=UPI00363B0683